MNMNKALILISFFNGLYIPLRAYSLEQGKEAVADKEMLETENPDRQYLLFELPYSE